MHRELFFKYFVNTQLSGCKIVSYFLTLQGFNNLEFK